MNSNETDFNLEKIEKMVYVLNGQKVMLDFDLAQLYGVEVKRLNEQVKRNRARFPADFYFECSFGDLEVLRSQFATTNHVSYWNHKRRSNPCVFTENGVAMLSSVLHSDRAIEVNITIMRIFTKLKSYLMMEQIKDQRVDKLEIEATKVFKIVFERLDHVESDVKELKSSKPSLAPARKKIGLK